MLDIGWIFENGGDIRKLIVALKDSPFDTTFGTDLVISLMEIFKKRALNHILINCFIPYLIYFLATICFFTLFTSVGIHNEEEKFVAYIMGFVIILLDIYFLCYEILVIKRDGIVEYMADGLFNYLDLITTVLNAVLVFITLREADAE